MQMKISVTAFVCCIVQGLYAQKPSLDLKATENWSSVGTAQISNDGRYCFYDLSGQRHTPRLILQSTENGWKREFGGATMPAFSTDGKKLLFQTGTDSLVIFSIKEDSNKFISGVSRFAFSTDGKKDWLGYFLKTNEGQLNLQSIDDETHWTIPSVVNYRLQDPGGSIIQTSQNRGGVVYREWSLLNFADQGKLPFWSTEDDNLNLSSYAFDSEHNRAAFIIHKNRESKNELWCYDFQSRSMYFVTADSLLFPGSNLGLSQVSFTKNGKCLVFFVNQAAKKTPDANAVKLDVWNYLDAKLQNVQILRYENFAGYTGVIDISTRKFFQLTGDNEQIAGRGNDYVLVSRDLGNTSLFESSWNAQTIPSFSVVSLKDGSRKSLPYNVSNPAIGMSSEGKWVIYFDYKKNNFFSYEPSTGITRNITAQCKTEWINKDDDHPEKALWWHPIRKTWLPGDSAVLIFDHYDIWLIDPSGKKAPMNITKGLGKRNKIKFEIEGEENMDRNPLLLKAVNTANKDQGFYTVDIQNDKAPEFCSIGPYAFGMGTGQPPVKAKNTNVWMIQRSSATEAPNYFVTRDFKTYTQLSNVEPQKEYNWYTTELHQWKSLDGTLLQGILYKPENFDSTKKYPVIFDYYERRSDELNHFIYPGASTDRINIPLFVTVGYLIFVPDIQYKVGYPGEGAYNSLVSAAKYLARFKWVDSEKMGLQGHSWGGYETNYIVAHTNLFAAACSAAGECDMISDYGSASRGGFAIWHKEVSQGRLAAAPWENPRIYIQNSPIFYADKVETPLLMMNNKNDRSVPFSQGLEFFTTLRRLGKRAWMLQYDNGDHMVSGKDAEDFHTRMMQFFDHYLKDSACPRWMLYGIDAKDKGVIDGLDLIKEKNPKTGKWVTPKQGGLLTDEERKKIEVLKHKKPVTETLK
jgi:dienelactone hydrolase